MVFSWSSFLGFPIIFFLIFCFLRYFFKIVLFHEKNDGICKKK
ncbi:hypothetical protein FUSO4_11295 [Fusobacterium necrophorum DJ-1]|uniref:Uncharacterized protein n=1 Tax=Fusobacterium necrophorum DJ-2 TaxID=1441737 RepID=A0AB73C1E6_9FUSO|nr:hypothetical protein FUSO5_12275 [Fusobacterium necrophorum BFTR-1]KDE61727.1 hypothetical protein FUSO4_11295 [Fusobacterium necrophorum DJ-1]KDE70328.1 hypothetical protein FUSO8_09355 [Fusobacterium necrophorum DJ-2]